MIKKFGDNYYNLPIFLKQMLTVFMLQRTSEEPLWVWSIEQYFSKFNEHSNYLGILIKEDSIGLGEDWDSASR